VQIKPDNAAVDLLSKEILFRRRICETSERTATRDLSYLVSLNIFEQRGITGEGTAYILRCHKDAKDAISDINSTSENRVFS